MELNITLSAWLIPMFITIVAYTWALTKEKPTGNLGDGLGTVFLLVPASLISTISWILYAIFK